MASQVSREKAEVHKRKEDESFAQEEAKRAKTHEGKYNKLK